MVFLEAHVKRIATRQNLTLLFCTCLVVVAFTPTLSNGFIRWDDDANFLENFQFRGLTFESIAWAWTTAKLGVYQPLAWMLFEIQYVGFGLSAWGYHLTSLLLHLANTFLFFRLAQRLFGITLPNGQMDKAAGLAAMFFALHPLRVETVAWASAQPYLGAAFFSLLSLITYIDEKDSKTIPWKAMGFYATALLFKPAAMGLCFIFILLDYYPFKKPFTVKKQIPFLGLGLLAGIIAVGAREANGIENTSWLREVDLISILSRLGYSTLFYVRKTLLPFNLAGFYPTPTEPVLGPLGIMLAAFALLFTLRKSKPSVFTIGMAYLLLSLPFLGFLRVGTYLVADRYSYLSTMGFYLGLGALWALAPKRWMRTGSGILGTALVLLWGLTVIQTGYWKNSIVFWKHALEIPETRAMEARHEPFVATARFGLAESYCDRKPPSPDGLREALRTVEYWKPWNFDVGKLLLSCGWPAEAEKILRRETELNPRNGDGWNYLGLALNQLNRRSEAKEIFQKGIGYDPTSVNLRSNLGILHELDGQHQDAALYLQEALRMAPEDRQIQKELFAIQNKMAQTKR